MESSIPTILEIGCRGRLGYMRRRWFLFDTQSRVTDNKSLLIASTHYIRSRSVWMLEP